MVDYDVKIALGDWKRTALYEMMMRNLIEELNVEETKEMEPWKVKYEQVILNLGLTFPKVEFEGDLDDLGHLAALKKQKDVVEATRSLVKFICDKVKQS